MAKPTSNKIEDEKPAVTPKTRSKFPRTFKISEGDPITNQKLRDDILRIHQNASSKQGTPLISKDLKKPSFFQTMFQRPKTAEPVENKPKKKPNR